MKKITIKAHVGPNDIVWARLARFRHPCGVRVGVLVLVGRIDYLKVKRKVSSVTV